jgi:hypothetical protein
LKKSFVAVTVCVLLAACAATDMGIKPLTAQMQFDIGNTTRSDVINALGLPQEITRGADGNDTYWYEPTAKLSGLCVGCGFSSNTAGAATGALVESSTAEAKRARAKLVFDSNGMLIEYSPAPKARR